MLFFQNCSQFQAACMKMFLLKLKYYIHLQAFKFSVQAALEFLICPYLMQRRHHQVGSINQRLIKLKQGQKTAFPFPLMVSPCLAKGKHSSLPYTPIPIRFLSPYILLYAVSEPRSSICTHLYSHVYGLCFTPFFYLLFFG